MVVRVNTNLSELRQQQQATAAAAHKQAAAPESKKAPPKADSAEIRAAIASENKAAGRSEPLDPGAAAATAAALRAQINANPAAALGAHDISADRARELLS